MTIYAYTYIPYMHIPRASARGNNCFPWWSVSSSRIQVKWLWNWSLTWAGHRIAWRRQLDAENAQTYADVWLLRSWTMGGKGEYSCIQDNIELVFQRWNGMERLQSPTPWILMMQDWNELDPISALETSLWVPLTKATHCTHPFNIAMSSKQQYHNLSYQRQLLSFLPRDATGWQASLAELEEDGPITYDGISMHFMDRCI